MTARATSGRGVSEGAACDSCNRRKVACRGAVWPENPLAPPSELTPAVRAIVNTLAEDLANTRQALASITESLRVVREEQRQTLELLRAARSSPSSS